MALKYLPIDVVVGQTKWSDGLKKSMIEDFIIAGYGNVIGLMGANAKETSKNIQSKVNGFSSDKNTYLQANQLADIIHSMSAAAPKRFYKRKAQTDASQDGDVLKDCSGWTITKKNLEDGRIVYNANIKAETPKNKGDWTAIKGDVYVETGFKWNYKFQKFEKWGQIEREADVIEDLCKVLSKYYEGGEKPVPETPAPQAPTPDASLPEVGDRFIVKTEKSGIVYEITKMDMGTVFIKPDGRDFEVPYTFSEVKNNFADGRWVKIQDEEEETPAPQGEERLFMVGDIFYARGFENDRYFISSINSNDEVGFASLENPKGESIFGTVDEVNKLFKEGKWVKDGRYDYPEETPKAKSKEENSIPANPKLDYCKINWAEGLAEYADKFPKQFSSFTELTKFIADNIGEVPKRGYDKHGVEWKWKFLEGEETDRWDVSETEANPFKYPNLFASESMQSLCYMAWNIETDEGTTFLENDYFFAVRLGKEGMELNDEQFNKMLNGFLTYYKEDKKRFKYNTPEERLQRFRLVYPKLYELFNSSGKGKSKEDIEKAIKGLQFLADKGNEKAKKAIIGLKILLNK